MSTTSIAPLFQGASTKGINFGTNYPIIAQTLNDYTYVLWASVSSENTTAGSIFYSPFGNINLQTSPTDTSLVLSYNGETLLDFPDAYQPDVISQFALTFGTVVDGNGSVTLFVNGVELGSASLPNITSNQDGSLYFLNNITGQLKYVRIYNACLSPEELYNNTFNITPEDASNIVAEFNYALSTPACVIGNYILTTIPEDQVLVENLGVQFDGSSALVCPELSSNFGLANTSFTVQSWVYIDANPPTWQALFCNQTATAGFSFFLEFNGDQTLLGIMRSGDNSPATVVINTIAGQWANVAITYANGNISFWLNGTAVIENYQMPALSQTGNSGIPKVGAVYQDYFFSQLNAYLVGTIQSVGIWDRSISQEELQAYMYNVPSFDDTLVAFYNLGLSPQDLVDDQGFSLEGNPVPNLQKTYFDIGATLPAPLYDVAPPGEEPEYTEAKVKRQATTGFFSDGTPMFSEAHLEKMVAAYKKNLDSADSKTAAKTAQYKAQVKAAFDAAKEDPTFLKKLNFHVQHHFDRDDVVFTFHHADGKTEEVHRAKKASIDECTIFWISFGITVICAIFAVLGVSLVPKKISDFVTQKLIPTCLNALKNIFVGAITGATLVAVINVLWEYDLLSSLVWTCVKSLGWWGLGKLLVKLIALVIPGADAAAIAAYIAGAVIAVAKVVVAYTEKPSTC